jgi:hypothetical protein
MQFYLQSRSAFFWLGCRRSASGFIACLANRLTSRPCSPSCGIDISMSKPESRCSRPIGGHCGCKPLKFHSVEHSRKIVCFILPQAYLQDSVEHRRASALTVIDGPSPAFLSEVIGGGKRRPARPDIDHSHLLNLVRIRPHVGSYILGDDLRAIFMANSECRRILMSRRPLSGLDQIEHALVVVCSLYRIDHDAAAAGGSTCYWILHGATWAVAQH